MATVIRQGLPASVQQLSHISECAICHDVYRDPRMLPCIHSFCFDCLCNLADGIGPGDSMNCPMCRKSFTIPIGGLAALPKNFYMRNLAEFHTVRHRVRAEPRIKCTICGSRSPGHAGHSPDRSGQTLGRGREDEDEDCGQVHRWATKYCLDCRQEMCSKCASLHQMMKISKGHNIVEMGSMMNTEKLRNGSLFCDKHEDEALKMYCHQCHKLICLTCFAEEHQRHRCDNIKAAIAYFQTQASTDLEKIRLRRNECHNALDCADREKERLQGEVDKCKIELKRMADGLKMKIDMDKLALLNKTTEVGDVGLKQLSELKMDLEQKIDAMEGYELFTREIFDKGSPTDIASISRDLHMRASELLGLFKEPPLVLQVPAIQTKVPTSGNQVGTYTSTKRYIQRQIRSSEASKVAPTQTPKSLNVPNLGIVLGALIIPVTAILLILMLAGVPPA